MQPGHKEEKRKTCEGNKANTHEGKVFGRCERCEEFMCEHCAASKHYDHIEAYYSYDTECVLLANYLTQLKAGTSKALRNHDKLLPPLESATATPKLHHDLQAHYAGFQKLIQSHCTESILALRRCHFLSRLRDQLALINHGVQRMAQLRTEVRQQASTLLQASAAGKYRGRLGVVFNTKVYKARAQALIEAQHNETNKVLEKLQRFRESYVGIDMAALDRTLAIRNIDMLDAKVFKTLRSPPALATYCVTAQTLAKTHFHDYSLPYHAALIAVRGCVYIIGGCGAEKHPAEPQLYFGSTTVLNVESAVMTTKGSLQSPRASFGVASQHQAAIFAVGGWNHEGPTADCERYSCTTESWSLIPPLNAKKSHTAASVFGPGPSLLYCVGGLLEGSVQDIRMERIDLNDIEHAQWTVVNIVDSPSWTGGQDLGLAELAGKELLVFGGKRDGKARADAWIFSPERSQLAPLASLKRAGSFGGCQTVSFLGKIYTFSGEDSCVHAYDIKERQWELLEPIPVRSPISSPKRYRPVVTLQHDIAYASST